ncbi:Wzz/FepE/Etk N-terminal domain-containing protein [Lunatimonas salinarum]|uniref:Wzz/FepE/Etk N-terminal domain-containing protein n=1 Tax=Lunatimonas salinarum TaxID=1774590 RepID=UPI001ADF30DE|nr:Wzz/FepE/Etk N-terminal domain-containing protein [Lunatimonas salinarum]
MLDQPTDDNSKTNPRSELDLLALIKTIWEHRKQLYYFVGVFAVLGLVAAFVLPKQFTASSTFVPQTAESGRAGGSLSGLASLAGISLGNIGAGSEIPPSLYPKIVSSATFRKSLLESKISVSGSSELVTYRQYYEEIYSPGLVGSIKDFIVGLPGMITKLVTGDSEVSVSESNNGLIVITKKESDLFKRLESQLVITPNEKEGFVTISFVLPEPLMAAQMATHVQNLLQEEVIAYKITNAKEQLKFTEERYREKKTEFEEIQSKLATFRDRNQNIVSATAQNQLQRLEAEYNFAFTIYTELAKQLEQAKLQVSKDTPVFSVIQPVTIPIEKSAPRRPIVIIIFAFLGGVLGIGYIFAIEFISEIRRQWDEK